MSPTINPERVLIGSTKTTDEESKEGSLRTNGLAVCLIACVVGTLLYNEPELRFWWCWSASVLLLVASLLGKVFILPSDYTKNEQTLRPWFLLNSVFCVYNFITSIFYWLDLHGWFFLHWDPSKYQDSREIELASICQYIFLLGHVSFLIGMGVAMRMQRRHYAQYTFAYRGNLASILLSVAIIGLCVKVGFSIFPGLMQFAVRGQALATIASAISLGVAFRTGSHLFATTVLANVFMLVLALASGWKEEVLVLIILNAISFYPAYPVITTITSGMVMALGFLVLPTLSSVVREESWKGERSSLEALQIGIENVRAESNEEIISNSWRFLTGRISEVSMTTRYVNSVPDKLPFYGTKIFEQAVVTPVPRYFWPSKAITEAQVHQRVVENGVVSELSVVSAKPTYITDAYLSFGFIGVVISLFLYGVAAQWFSAVCERNLGGVVIGGVVYNGLFAIMWRSSCWEFMFNTCVWSLICVYIIHLLAARQGWLKRVV